MLVLFVAVASWTLQHLLLERPFFVPFLKAS
jgi:hypothetical protein